jgi:hypothetical protein
MGIDRMIHAFPAILLLGFFAAAQADVTLQFTDTAGADTGSTLMIKGGDVRMEEREGDGSMVYSLFDRKTRTLTMVIDEERSYAQLTAEGLKAQAHEVRGMQENFLAQMREQMAQMPPEQRQMMEQQMRQMGVDPAMLSGEDPPAPDLSSLETRATGEQRTIGGFRCQVMEVLLEGEITNELCVADAGHVGLSAADFETLKVLFEFMQSLSEIAMSMGGPFAADMGAEMLPAVDGVPVLVKNLQDGTEITLQSVSTDTLSPDLFRIPSGYERVDPF